jgi:hypothetical protein
MKGQRTGMRMLLQRAGVATVKFRYQGEFISAEILDAAGGPCAAPDAQHAGNLRHIAVAQLDANPGGPELWHRSAGVLEWILDGDITLSQRNYPGSDHDLKMGQDLREVAGMTVSPAEGQPESEAERPRMYA